MKCVKFIEASCTIKKTFIIAAFYIIDDMSIEVMRITYRKFKLELIGENISSLLLILIYVRSLFLAVLLVVIFLFVKLDCLSRFDHSI